jgi:hypothetical protein
VHILQGYATDATASSAAAAAGVGGYGQSAGTDAYQANADNSSSAQG